MGFEQEQTEETKKGDWSVSVLSVSSCSMNCVFNSSVDDTMRNSIPKLTVLVSLASMLVLHGAAAWAADEFRAGAATSNITPPIGGNIVGGFSPAPSTHIHDELHARCLVLDDGKTKLAL